MSALLKAHCAQRDYLIDLSGGEVAPAERVAALCHRQSGIGAEGYLHVAKRGADLHVTCLNDRGVATRPSGNDLLALAACLDADAPRTVHTAAGPVTFGPDARGYRLALGPAILPAGEIAQRDGFDCAVTITGLAHQRPALSVTVASPHVVIALPDDTDLSALPWLAASDIEIDPAPREGATSCLVIPSAGASGMLGAGELRVIDRERGEVPSSVFAAGAAAHALRTWAGGAGPTSWQMRAYGGDVWVEFDGDAIDVIAPAQVIAEVSPRG